MITFYNPLHAQHHGKLEMFRGAMVPCHEVPARADHVLAELQQRKLGVVQQPFSFDDTVLERIHSPRYLHFLRHAWSEWIALDPGHAERDILPSVWPIRSFRSDVLPDNFAARMGLFSFDAGTPMTAGTWMAARAGADCALSAAQQVVRGERAAFALSRPPGHHAGADFFGGYCFLNNAALAAQYLRDAGVARVAILDIDYHHGNGTQSIFYDRDDVFFASLHGDPRTEYPFYLGHADERGAGKGQGANLNLPLPRGTTFAAWSAALELALAAIAEWGAQALVVSLGLDTFVGDPISGFALQSTDYVRVGERLAQMHLPTVLIFEGGYAVTEIGVNAANVLQAFTTVPGVLQSKMPPQVSDMTELIAPSASHTATVLCVDDDPLILTLLSRLLKAQGYQVLVAGSAQDGLKILDQQRVELVISDLRMPGTDGIQFLAQVRSRWPLTMRILLTAHSEVEDTIAAINEGGIYRFVSKPVDKEDLLQSVRNALVHHFLTAERDRLQTLTQEQNRQLQVLNADLEAQVRSRTAEFETERNRVAVANEKLKASFAVSVKVFSKLIDMNEGSFAGHAHRVAELARHIAMKLGLDRGEVQDIYISGLLHDIGMIGAPTALRSKSVPDMSALELEQFKQHPVRGAMVLMAVSELRQAGRLIRSHHERYDGLGYPDGLSGNDVPLGARILSVANDFDDLQAGAYGRDFLSKDEALEFIVQWRGKRFDPKVVDTFLDFVQSGGLGVLRANSDMVRELALQPQQLEPGMVLSRDLVSCDGLLLLAQDYALDAEWIAMIREFSSAQDPTLLVHIDGDKMA